MIALRNYIEEKREQQKKILSIYLTAGYPSLSATLPLLDTIVEAGADLIELGIPFSDPLADGPIIQDSSHQALESGMTLARSLELAREFKQRHDTPLLFMGYVNPFMKFGWDALFTQAKSAGVAGFIIPDLPPEEGHEVYQGLNDIGLGLISLVSPNTPQERITYINSCTNSFIYAVSVKGVTGEREQLPADTSQFLTRLRQSSPHPMLVGFGVSNPQIAHQMSSLSDGVIIGSAVIRRIADAPDLTAAQQAVGAFIREIKEAM